MVQKAKISRLLEAKMSDLGISMPAAADQIGISYPSLHRIYRGHYDSCHLVTAKKLSLWLGLELNDLLEPAQEDVAEGLGVAADAA